MLYFRLCKAALELPLCNVDEDGSFRDDVSTLASPLCFILCHGE